MNLIATAAKSCDEYIKNAVSEDFNPLFQFKYKLERARIGQLLQIHIKPIQHQSRKVAVSA